VLFRWPGNVRQLQNEMRRLVALADRDSELKCEALDLATPGASGGGQVSRNGSELSISLRSKLIPTLARIEKEMIQAALNENGGRVDAAAKALGISRKGLYLKRLRLGL